MMSTLATIMYILYTVVFCLWSIYIIYGIKRKRSFYKSAFRCVEGESDTHQHMLAYNAKAQLVKFVYLFCVNLIELVGINLAGVEASMIMIEAYQKELPSHPIITNSIFQLPPMFNVCAITSLATLGSLCDYLSVRYAHKSWIKSEKFPYLKFPIFFMVYSRIVRVE